MAQNSDKRVFVQIFQRCQNRQAANKLRNKTEFQQIFRLKLFQQLARIALFRHINARVKADRGLIATPRNNPLQPGKRTAANEQDIGCVNLQEFLLRMLATTLRRHRGNRAFHDFQQSLLHALARHIARDGRVVRLAADFIDLINIDNAALRPLDIIIGGLQ